MRSPRAKARAHLWALTGQLHEHGVTFAYTRLDRHGMVFTARRGRESVEVRQMSEDGMVYVGRRRLRPCEVWPEIAARLGVVDEAAMLEVAG